MRKRFCDMFSESSTGSWAELQLPCCPSKQGELPENMLQNLLHNLPPQTVDFWSRNCVKHGATRFLLQKYTALSTRRSNNSDNRGNKYGSAKREEIMRLSFNKMYRERERERERHQLS